MFDFQSGAPFFAQAPGMMEEMCEQELKELGAEATRVSYRGVYFKADLTTLYRINYSARMISRVLAPLTGFFCRSTDVLIEKARKIAWEEIFSLNQTFSITASVAKSQITNSLYASQCLKDGIVDHFRDIYGRRPDVDTVNPDVRFNLHIEKDKAVISLDTSGDSLHKRGYRLLAGEAPMQETLAAAIIRVTEWNGEQPLWDPMCGSGTLLCEALMHYCRIPAQYLRKKFGFFALPGFNKDAWEQLKAELDSQIRPLPEGLISGSDKYQRILNTAQDNLSRLPFGDKVKLSCHPFSHVNEYKNGVLVVNPPYGIRLGEIEEVRVLYKELGDFLKQRCPGTTAYIYMGDPALRKEIGLRTSRRVPLVNGKLEGVLVKIESYEGSKKAKWRDAENTP